MARKSAAWPAISTSPRAPAKSRNSSKSESPEEADLGSAHYMMTPWHALQLSLAGEERALAYFTSIVENTKDPKVKAMAAELVEEEAEHVQLVHRLLRRIPSRAKPGPTISIRRCRRNKTPA